MSSGAAWSFGSRPDIVNGPERRGAATRDTRRRWFLPLALVTLELLCLSGWLRWIAAMGWTATRPPGALATVAVGAVATTVVVATLARPWAPFAVLVGCAASALALAWASTQTGGTPAATWGALRAGLGLADGRLTGTQYAMGVGVVAWWRAVRHGARPPASGAVRRTVAVTIGGFTLLALAVRMTFDVALGGYLLAAAVIALAAMALARVDDTALSGEGSGLGPAWSLVLPVAIGLVLIVAALLSAVVSLDLASEALEVIAPLPVVLARLVLLVVLTLLSWLSRIVAPLTAALQRALANQPNSMRGVGESLVTPPAPADGGSLPTWIVLLAWTLLAVLVLGLAGLWLRRALRRYTTVASDEGVERHMELSRARVLADAKGLVQELVARAAARLRGRGEGPGGIRALYAQFLRLMAAQGSPRPVAATPWEFAGVARGVLPGVAAEVAELTAGYVAVRYGDAQLDAATDGRLEAAWATLLNHAERREDG